MRKQSLMKSVAIIAATILPLLGCDNKFEGGDFRVKSFTSSGCSSTKASTDEDAATKSKDGNGYLSLNHTDGCLEVSLCDFTTGCEIKEGFDCDAFLEGNTISIYVKCKTTDSANCICTLDKVKTVISGLEEGKYSLIYYFSSGMYDLSKRVDFNYSATLHKKVTFISYD